MTQATTPTQTAANQSLPAILNAAAQQSFDTFLQTLNTLDGLDMVLHWRGQQAAIRNFRQKVAVAPGPPSYCQDGLCTVVNASFMGDQRFMDAYDAGAALGSWRGKGVHWRLYNLCYAARRAMDLEGDFVECGCYRGSSAMCVLRYVDLPASDKTFYMLDTFQGVDMDLLTSKERQMGIGTTYDLYEDCWESVQAAFDGLDCVRLIRGSVPATLEEVTSEKISYLHIDMNCAAPEIAAAEYFWDRLVPGAMVFLDDYAWKLHPVQKKAFDEFAERKGVQVLTMPTGQGMMIKP